MYYLIIAFLISTTLTAFLVRSRSWHVSWSSDALPKPQKAHHGNSSRIGGIAIFIAILACWIVFFFKNHNYSLIYSYVIASSLPIFFIGLAEDVTKKVNFLIRLVLSLFSAGILIALLEIPPIKVGIHPIDRLLHYPWITYVFLIFAIGGLSHAYNLIDGLNGLASMISILSLLAILYVSIKVNDSLPIYLSGVCIGAIAGFFIWNYPRGLIFLGDGGAYLIGFWVAALSILVVVRNPDVSPWFALAVNTYPVFETLFTIWRRSIHKNRSVMMPDGAHFHSLIYRRIMRWANSDVSGERRYLSNAKTSPYLWILSSVGLIPAVLFWNSTLALINAIAVFVVCYIYLYRKIVQFNTPSWMFTRPPKI